MKFSALPALLKGNERYWWRRRRTAPRRRLPPPRREAEAAPSRWTGTDCPPKLWPLRWCPARRERIHFLMYLFIQAKSDHCDQKLQRLPLTVQKKNASIWTRLTGLSGQTRLWLDGPLWTEEKDEGELVGIRQAKGSGQSAIDRLPSGWWGADKDWSQSNTPAWGDRATNGSWITGGYRVRTHHGRISHKPLVKRGMSSCRSTWSPDCRSHSSRLSACDPCWTCSWPCCPRRVETDYRDQPFQITWSQPGREQTKERE